jgi:hypothetical protein
LNDLLQQAKASAHATKGLDVHTERRNSCRGPWLPPVRLAAGRHFLPLFCAAEGLFRPIANAGIAAKACQTRMSSHPDETSAAVTAAFAKIPAWLERDPALIARGRFLDCDCLLGPLHAPLHIAIRAGRIVELTPAPVLMRSWRFSYRATSMAWAQYWQPMPRPGWHDLLALTKRGEAVLEGDLHPFMTNLQYFKDVLALPRQYAEVTT